MHRDVIRGYADASGTPTENFNGAASGFKHILRLTWVLVLVRSATLIAASTAAGNIYYN